MTNRRDLALAVAAGYALGRMKKGKLAVGVGSLLMGKRINLSPGQLTEVLSKQISANPQLAEIRDQLRGELQGVGKSVKSALVTRQLDSLSNNLRERTLVIRDRLSAGPLTGHLSKGDEETADGEERAGKRSGAADGKPESDAYEARGEAEQSRPRRESPAKKAPAKRAPAKKATAKKTASAGKKTASAAKKTTSAGKKTSSTAKKTTSSARRTSSRRSEGDDRG